MESGYKTKDMKAETKKEVLPIYKINFKPKAPSNAQF